MNIPEQVEHAACVGSDYMAGVNGQRIAIVGYSHWNEKGEVDTVDATTECIRRAISGE